MRGNNFSLIKKNSSTIINFLLLCALATLFGGCSCLTVKPPKPMETVDAPDKLTNVSYATDEDYIKIIGDRLAKVKTFTGSGKLMITGSDKTDSATGNIVIARPDSLRLEGFTSLFGKAIFFLASKKDRFAIYVPNDKKYYKGRNTVENIQKILPIDISISDFSDFLLGDVRKHDGDKFKIKFLEDTNVYKIYFYGVDGSKRELWFDPALKVIKKCAVFDDYDELKAMIKYSDFKEFDGHLMPMSIAVKFPMLDTRIDVEYEDVKINGKVSRKLFNLKVPKKAKIINLDPQRLM